MTGAKQHRPHRRCLPEADRRDGTADVIYCYELLAGFSAPAAEEVRELAPGDSLEEMYGQMERTLLRIGYLNPQNPAHLMRSLRRIFARAALDQREVTIVRGMMSQIDWAASEFRGKKGA